MITSETQAHKSTRCKQRIAQTEDELMDQTQYCLSNISCTNDHNQTVCATRLCCLCVHGSKVNYSIIHQHAMLC